MPISPLHQYDRRIGVCIGVRVGYASGCASGVCAGVCISASGVCIACGHRGCSSGVLVRAAPRGVRDDCFPPVAVTCRILHRTSYSRIVGVCIWGVHRGTRRGCGHQGCMCMSWLYRYRLCALTIPTCHLHIHDLRDITCSIYNWYERVHAHVHHARASPRRHPPPTRTLPAFVTACGGPAQSGAALRVAGVDLSDPLRCRGSVESLRKQPLKSGGPDLKDP